MWRFAYNKFKQLVDHHSFLRQLQQIQWEQLVQQVSLIQLVKWYFLFCVAYPSLNGKHSLLVSITRNKGYTSSPLLFSKWWKWSKAVVIFWFCIIQLINIFYKMLFTICFLHCFSGKPMGAVLIYFFFKVL